MTRVIGFQLDFKGRRLSFIAPPYGRRGIWKLYARARQARREMDKIGEAYLGAARCFNIARIVFDTAWQQSRLVDRSRAYIPPRQSLISRLSATTELADGDAPYCCNSDLEILTFMLYGWLNFISYFTGQAGGGGWYCQVFQILTSSTMTPVSSKLFLHQYRLLLYHRTNWKFCFFQMDFNRDQEPYRACQKLIVSQTNL